MKPIFYLTAAELESIWTSTHRGEWGWLDHDAPDNTAMMLERQEDPDAWDYGLWSVSLIDDYGDWQCVSDARWTDEDMGSMAYAAQFAAIRRALGWSQADTAKALDRSLSWVRRVEQGQIPCPSYAVYAMRWLQHQHHTSAP